jgi:Zn-finger nucleic acid-binding protein
MAESVICLHCGGALGPRPKADPASAARGCACGPGTREAKSVLCPQCGGSIKLGTRACPYCDSTVATCRCGTCLAWNLAEAAHCQACGKRLGAASEGTARTVACECPRCRVKLQSRDYADLSVEECDKCGGLFLAPGMVEHLVAARDAPTGMRLALPKREVKRDTSVRYLNCPRCGKLMNRQAFGRISGVVLDVCKQHGLWFDGGELAEVIRFVEQGGLERARELDRDELAERERRRRADDVITEASAGLDMEASSAGSGRSSSYQLFPNLVRFIADLWR